LREEPLTNTETGNNFNLLVAENKDAVYRLCYKVLRSREDAEDMAQETFISAYRSMDSFRSEANIKTWLYRIALNKCLDFRRKQSAQKRMAFLQSIFGNSAAVRQLKSAVSLSPERPVEDDERRAILDTALNQIPEKQRTALLLSKTEGLSQKEIAETMNISVGAVESLISRAKENLRKLLYDYYNDSR